MEAMKKLRIEDHGRVESYFTEGIPANVPTTVREGQVRIYIDWTLFPEGRIVSGWATGKLFVGERVYGRFTQVELDGGAKFPVCLEMREVGSHTPTRQGILGAPRLPGSTGSDTALIENGQRLRVVSRFE
jgi:hypothetical protein